MDPILAAILAMTAKVTGSGIKGGGEYLLGKSSSSSGSGGSDNGLINKVVQGNKAIKAAGDTSAAGVGENAGVAATGTASAGAAGGTAGGTASAGAAGGASAAAGAAGGGAALAASDEKLKRVCGDNADLIDLFSKIGSYEFNYTDKAKALYPNGKNHVDSKRHVGVMAQELEKNPATNAVINTEKNGYKTVDTAQLTLTNTAVLADVCRRLEALEKQLGI